MITYQVEKYINCVEEMKPLFDSQWAEVEDNQDTLKLDPNYEQYNTLCDAGMLQVVTARNDRELIGYLVVFIVPHLHHKDSIWAMSDIFYIKPQYRKTDIAVTLINFSERKLKKRGVSIMNLNMKAKAPYIELAESCGFKEFEMTYSKYIGK